MRTITGAPLALTIVRMLQRSRIKGASFLMRQLARRGAFNSIAQYDVGGSKFVVPLYRIPWDRWDVMNYEFKLIQAFCEQLKTLGSITLFDCGADIGTFSSLVCAHVHISRIIAFEPNSEVHTFLQMNLSNAGIPFEFVPKAVSNFTGSGVLERPAYDPSDHARYLIPGDGPVQVTEIDKMSIRGGDIAIKLDIEGGELNALQGAAETIKSARECVITLEAHPLVAKRTKHDPVECLRFLESLRHFEFTVAETNTRASLSEPILTDGQQEVFNIVGRSLRIP